MPELDKRDYVVRYAAFGFNARKNPNVGLWYYSTGALTAGGKVYATLGNPTKDYVAGKSKNPGATKIGELAVKKPAKVKVTSLRVSGKKIKVTIKKIKKVNGYQIRWSDDKKFNGYWQKNSKSNKYTIKKLDANTRYYVKVRAYRLNGKKKLYGSWSGKKSIKVTK